MDENELESVEKVVPSAPYDTNLSDVIEVIKETDPDFKESTTSTSTMYNGGGEMPTKSASAMPQQGGRPHARIRIIEQPASKALRFRYECEGRSAGSIPGASSTPENKTYPTIRVEGYRGRAVVVVSCVTKDEPYKAHPHNLVGREGCRRGVCTLEISPESMTVQFSNLGIQCVKKRDIEQALRVREEIRVDPFRQGFNHRNQPTTIDLNAVRLCFQVFLENSDGRFTVAVPPVVSEPIYDKKAMSDLIIIKLSDCVSYVDGGRKDIILLCEKVAKEDIQVCFYEEVDGHIVWEGMADIQPAQVHKQHAIWFRTPKYKTLDVTEPVKAFIQLRRPSDNMTSEPLPFELLPLNSGKRKRQKIDDPDQIIRHLQEHDKKGQYQLNIPMDPIKTEPRDTTSPYGGSIYGSISPAYMHSPSLSPQYNMHLDSMGPTPPPNHLPYQFQNIPDQISILAGAGTTTSQSWNIPSTSQVGLNVFGAVSNTPQRQQSYGTDILDLDTQQINSAELRSLINANEAPLPDMNNLSLSDIIAQPQDVNMTDSLTRLANTTLDNMNFPPPQ